VIALKKPTERKLEILNAIKTLSEKSEFGIIRAIDIIEHLNGNSTNIRTMLTRLKAEKLLDNPLYGHWKLTERGINALEQFKTIN
jgi:Mn-dependent DtxR family transcriptional regulator